jgi:probable rRNA maturation factor
MQSGAFSQISPQLLGDVVISVETAQRESAQGDMDFEKRVDELLIHGILHLFGYDHVNDAQSAREMDRKSTELLQLITPP